MGENFAKRVADRIRELREARGISLRELSRRSGVAPESVSRSERGVTDVTLTNLAKIATGLGVSLPEFFAFEMEPDWTKADLQVDVRRVVDVLTRATPDARARIALAVDLVSGADLPLRGTEALPAMGMVSERYLPASPKKKAKRRRGS